MAKQDFTDWSVYVRDKCVCAYCGADARRNLDLWRQLQIDHIVPGGPDTDDNKAVACYWCNLNLGGFDPPGSSRAEKIQSKRDHLAKKYADTLRDFGEMQWEIVGALP